MTADHLLYGDIQRIQGMLPAPVINWRDHEVELNSDNLNMAEPWVLGDWVGTSGWTAKARADQVPPTWFVAGTDHDIFDLHDPDPDSRELVTKLAAKSPKFLAASVPVQFEAIGPGELEVDDPDLVLRCITDDQEPAHVQLDKLTTAAAVLAVEHLLSDRGEGEWRYNSQVGEALYVINGAVVGTVWVGPEGMLH